jgi:phosphatidylinositol glycan class O
MATAFSSSRRSSPINSKRRPKLADLVVPLLAIGGLYWFSASFFLAKRSLPHVSKCDEARTLLVDVLSMTQDEADLALPKDENETSRGGCWLPRRIDSMVILVVDALRFDFARYRLPLSVGARIQLLQSKSNNQTMASQLLQFVADPPTVTMQRLKGLTTGSLPTFADISGNMVRKSSIICSL